MPADEQRRRSGWWVLLLISLDALLGRKPAPQRGRDGA